MNASSWVSAKENEALSEKKFTQRTHLLGSLNKAATAATCKSHKTNKLSFFFASADTELLRTNKISVQFTRGPHKEN